MQAISSDGRWLISCSVDSTVKTWDLPSGKYDIFHALLCFLVVCVNKNSEYCAVCYQVIHLWLCACSSIHHALQLVRLQQLHCI